MGEAVIGAAGSGGRDPRSGAGVVPEPEPSWQHARWRLPAPPGRRTRCLRASRSVRGGAAARQADHVMVEVAVADLAGDDRHARSDPPDCRSSPTRSSIARSASSSAASPEGCAVIARRQARGARTSATARISTCSSSTTRPPRPAGKDPGDHFVRAAQRIIRLTQRAASGRPGYELDTRLRPSGSQRPAGDVAARPSRATTTWRSAATEPRTGGARVGSRLGTAGADCARASGPGIASSARA